MNKVKTHPLRMYRGGAFGKTLFKKLSIAAACALLFAAAPVFMSCTNSSDSGGGNSGGETGGGTNTAETFTVSFSVEGGNGTLKAQSDGIEETDTGAINVAKDKTVTFTATPDEDYRVKEWKLDGKTVVGNTTNTFEHPVTEAVTVKVSFESTATPPEYTPVTYANLAAYLQGLPEDSTVHKIEVTDLVAANLKGSPSSGSEESSIPLGKVLKANSDKKVALKLPETIEGLTDMRYCFYKCENLVSVVKIPGSVTNMRNCFYGCKNLKTVPNIPDKVTNMEQCFYDCQNLQTVPNIPDGVTNMDQCFFNCKELTTAPTIPNRVVYMRYCFKNCTKLEEAQSISNNVKDMTQCFYGCTSLKSAPNIPYGVTNMANCFNGCQNLTTAPEIPASVKDMRYCFKNCKNITSGTLKCNYNPGKIDNQPAFKEVFANCTELRANSIKVPEDFYDAYTAAEALTDMVVPGADTTEKKAKFKKF
ncbi:leucine-rich repeat domain-containing protein [Treponema socranskii]